MIEDDEHLCKVVAATLRGHAYDVMIARDGIAALQVLETFEPNVIVLDLAMSGLDGHGFLAAREERGDLVGVPVIVTSGAPATRDLASSTWDEFLLKPYCLPDLLAAIERRCVARHAHR